MTDRFPERGYNAQTVAIAQRRIMLFSFIWYPATLLGLGGLVHLLVSLLVGGSADIGIFVSILGAGLTLLFWLVTLPKRRARTPPEPARYMYQVRQVVRVNPVMIKVFWGFSVLLAVTTLVLPFVQAGQSSPELVPLSAFFAVFLAGIAHGQSYQLRHLTAATSEPEASIERTPA